VTPYGSKDFFFVDKKPRRAVSCPVAWHGRVPGGPREAENKEQREIRWFPKKEERAGRGLGLLLNVLSKKLRKEPPLEREGRNIKCRLGEPESVEREKKGQTVKWTIFFRKIVVEIRGSMDRHRLDLASKKFRRNPRSANLTKGRPSG